MPGEGRKNRDRGFRAERKVVHRFLNEGIKAERTYGSNGASRGLPSDVDIIIEGDTYLQSKVKKKLPAYLHLPDHLYAHVLMEDRKEPLVVLRLSSVIDLMRKDNDE